MQSREPDGFHSPGMFQGAEIKLPIKVYLGKLPLSACPLSARPDLSLEKKETGFFFVQNASSSSRALVLLELILRPAYRVGKFGGMFLVALW